MTLNLYLMNNLAGHISRIEAELEDQGDGFANDIVELLHVLEENCAELKQVNQNILETFDRLEKIEQALGMNQLKREKEAELQFDYDAFIQSLR